MFTPRSLSEARRCQWVKQSTKTTYRTFAAYGSYFDALRWAPNCTANRLLRQAGTTGSNPPLPRNIWPSNARKAPKLIDIISRARGGVWADFGCGLQLAQAELHRDHPSLARDIRMIGVDLFDWSVDDCIRGIPVQSDADRSIVEGFKGAVAASPATKLLTDLHTVSLPEKADVITSVEVIQYIEDKVAALCQWHNQLKVGGVALIATETSWLHWIRVAGEVLRDGAPDRFLADLTRHGVRVGLCGENYFRSPSAESGHAADASLLVIQRTSEVELGSVAPLLKSLSNPDGYQTSEYARTDRFVEARGAAACAA